MGDQSDRPGAEASAPADVPAPGWRQILVRAWKEQSDDNIGILSGAVAYFSFLAIFPALIAAISIWGLVSTPESAVRQAEGLTRQLPAGAGDVVTDQMTSVAESSGGPLTIGLVVTIVLALWSASGGMNTMIKALNIAYDETDDRGFIRGRVLALVLTIGAIVVILLALALIAALPIVLDLLELGAAATIAVQIGRFVLLALVIAVALAVIYRVGPNRADPRFSWVTPGAVLATVGWLLASIGFGLYVQYFGSYNKTYGAVASAAILLLWLYYTSFIILFGAEINAEAERQTDRDTTTGPEKPMGQRDANPADTKPATA